MSRTYRRKNALWNFHAYEYDYLDGFLNKIYFEKKSLEYSKAKADFHRDQHRYGSGVPSWFVTLYREKTFRQKSKNEIIKWVKNPEMNDCVLPEFTHDAGWYYW